MANSADLSRIIGEMQMSETERKERRQAYARMAAEDVALIERLSIEFLVLQTGNPMSGERIRQTVLRAVDVFNLYGRTLPRGYRVLGNAHDGGKTANYLQMTDGTKPNDAMLVADALTGWLLEIAEILDKRNAELRPKPEPTCFDEVGD